MFEIKEMRFLKRSKMWRKMNILPIEIKEHEANMQLGKLNHMIFWDICSQYNRTVSILHLKV